MPGQTKDLERELCELRKLTRRNILRDIDRSIRAARKCALPVNQVAQFALGAIMEHYEMSGDAEFTFKNDSARTSSCKAPAVSKVTVSRPKKIISKDNVRAHKAPTHDSKPDSTKASTSSKAPTKASTTKAPTPMASIAKDPTSKAPTSTATIYKAPAYTAPRDNTPKYELHNFRIPKYKTRIDRAPSDASTVSVVESVSTGENEANTRKRKASSELSDRPRQRMAPGAASRATR